MSNSKKNNRSPANPYAKKTVEEGKSKIIVPVNSTTINTKRKAPSNPSPAKISNQRDVTSTNKRAKVVFASSNVIFRPQDQPSISIEKISQNEGVKGIFELFYSDWRDKIGADLCNSLDSIINKETMKKLTVSFDEVRKRLPIGHQAELNTRQSEYEVLCKLLPHLLVVHI